MPEGDAVALFRSRLEERLINEKLDVISSRWEARIKGLFHEEVVGVKAHGKVLWLEFSDDTSLVIHLGMKGSWRFSDRSLRNEGAGKEGLLLVTQAGSALLRFPRIFDRVPTSRVFEHKSLRFLGPDILADDVKIREMVQNARAKDPEDKDIAELLLDQEICAGVGNIFKCEALATLKIHPWAPANAFNDDRLYDLFQTTREQMKSRLAGKLGDSSARPFSPLVYRRHKEGCNACGNEVLVEEHGGDFSRLTWWCPSCQILER